MLHKVIVVLGVFAVVHAGAAAAFADVYTFQPRPTVRTTPGDLWNLEQGAFYTWGLSWAMPEGQTVVSAVLSYPNVERRGAVDGPADGINSRQPGRDSQLYTHLLDSIAPPVATPMPTNWVDVGRDRQGGGSAFAGQGVLLGSYSGLAPGGETVSYVIPTEYLGWLGDGSFGFGIDSDFDLTNDGITLTIETRPAPVPVPAPGAMGLGAVGLGAIGLGSLLIGLIGWVKRRLA